jgi:hypothetical protein
MNTPSTDLYRFLSGCLLGICLGLWYGFLRPFRQKHPYWADFLFLVALFPVWLYHSFAICRGDLRIGYAAGLFIGCLLEEVTLGFLLRPVFSIFWRILARILSILTFPVKKFFKICGKIVIFLFATGKKWGIIQWNYYQQLRRKTGGTTYVQSKESIQPHPVGISAQLPTSQVRCSGSDCVGYSRSSDDPFFYSEEPAGTAATTISGRSPGAGQPGLRPEDRRNRHHRKHQAHRH